MKESHLLSTAWLCLLTLCVVANVHATIIYDNGVPDLRTAYLSDFDGQQVANKFVLQSGMATITDVHWWGVYEETSPPADNFTIQFFDSSGDVPEITPFTEINIGDVGRESTGDFLTGPGFAFEVFKYSAFIPDVILNHSTTYWIAMVNDTTSGFRDWGWLTSGFDGGARRAGTGPWSPTLEKFAFNLTGPTAPTIPESPPLWLIVPSLLGMIGISRRKKTA